MGEGKEEEIFRGEEVPLVAVFLQLLPPSALGPTLPDAISNVGATITLLNDVLVIEDTLSIVTRQGMVV